MKVKILAFFLALLVVVHAQVANPPEPATNPSPADGETGVSLNPVLTWTPGAGATRHKVYFGTNPEALTLVETIVVKPDAPSSLKVQ